MSNLLVYLMWLTFMSVQFGDKELTGTQLGSVFGMLIAALILDGARIMRAWVWPKP